MIPVYKVGTGRKGIFIHGFLEDQSMWDFLNLPGVEQLRVDLPGHGAAESSHYSSLDEIARELADLVKESNFAPEFIVGHSMGGYVALELIRLLPESKKLILLNSNFWTDSEQKKIDRKRIAEIVFSQKDLFLETAIPNLFGNRDMFKSQIERLVREAKQMRPEAIAMASLAMSVRRDNTEFVWNNCANILIVQGENDKTVLVDEMQNRLPVACESSLKILDSGHMSHIESIAEVERSILDFVSSK